LGAATTASAGVSATTAAKVGRLGLRFRAEQEGESEDYDQRYGHYQGELAARRDSTSAVAAAPFVDQGVVVRTQPCADSLPTNPEVPCGTSKNL
jgi:hypothetical protein